MPDITDSGTVTAMEDISGSEALYDAATCTGLMLTVGLGTEQVTVSSPAEIWPVTTLTGPFINPILKNVTTGKTLRWHNLTVPEFSVCVVDHYRQTVTVDGAVLRGHYPDIGEWWSVVLGDNVIESGGDYIGGTITMELREPA